MGIGGISIWQLLIVLLIVVLLFGTKKLRNMGGDVGSALKNFRQAVKDPDGEKSSEASGEGEPPEVEDQSGNQSRVVDAEVKKASSEDSSAPQSDKQS